MAPKQRVTASIATNVSAKADPRRQSLPLQVVWFFILPGAGCLKTELWISQPEFPSDPTGPSSLCCLRCHKGFSYPVKRLKISWWWYFQQKSPFSVFILQVDSGCNKQTLPLALLLSCTPITMFWCSVCGPVDSSFFCLSIWVSFAFVLAPRTRKLISAFPSCSLSSRSRRNDRVSAWEEKHKHNTGL